jgi:hypothetical protein
MYTEKKIDEKLPQERTWFAFAFSASFIYSTVYIFLEEEKKLD